jgi:hypothetical protein
VAAADVVMGGGQGTAERARGGPARRLAGSHAGDADRARLLAAKCLQDAERFDYPLYAMHMSVVATCADAMLGDPFAPGRADAAYADSEASGIRLFAPFYLLLYAEAHAALGRPAEVADRVARAWPASEELGDVPSAPRLLALADDLTAGRVQASRKP